MNSTITTQPASLGSMVQQTTDINKTKIAVDSIRNFVEGGTIGLVGGAIGAGCGASFNSALILGMATGACVGCCTTSLSKITTSIHNRTVQGRESTPPTNITTQPASLEPRVLQTTVIDKTKTAGGYICNIGAGGLIGLTCGATGALYGASLNSGLLLGMATGACVGCCNTSHSKITTSIHSRIVQGRESTPPTNV